MDIVILDSAYKHNEINIEDEVSRAVTAVEQGNYRQAAKRESMEVRLAALSAIVREMQEIVHNDKDLVNA